MCIPLSSSLLCVFLQLGVQSVLCQNKVSCWFVITLFGYHFQIVTICHLTVERSLHYLVLCMFPLLHSWYVKASVPEYVILLLSA